jgi:hypothetical protein
MPKNRAKRELNTQNVKYNTVFSFMGMTQSRIGEVTENENQSKRVMHPRFQFPIAHLSQVGCHSAA